MPTPISIIPDPGLQERTNSQTVRAQLALRQLVLSGEIKPGERLSELWIVEKIGVSRTPVRAALMLLAEEGLLKPLTSGGFALRVFSDQEVMDAIEIRGVVEGLAVRTAIERGVSKRALTSLQDLLQDLDQVVLEAQTQAAFFEAYVNLNARFHREIVALANSRVVERQLERIMALPFASPSAFVMAQSLTPEARQVLLLAQDQHHCIVEAIERGEGARAEALMREHSRLASRNLSQSLGSNRVLEMIPGAALIHPRSE